MKMLKCSENNFVNKIKKVSGLLFQGLIGVLKDFWWKSKSNLKRICQISSGCKNLIEIRYLIKDNDNEFAE